MIPRNEPLIPRPERSIPVDLNLGRARFASKHAVSVTRDEITG
jgi:hypothetical protein